MEHLHLLVHAGAPSSRQDDARYTAQAEAYSTLTASRVSRVKDRSRPSASTAEQPSRCAAAQNYQRDEGMKPVKPTADLDATVYLDDTQLAYTALESQLRSFSRSVVKQTPARSHAGSVRGSPAATASNKRQARQSQSSYLVSPQLERSKQGRRVQPNEQAQKLRRQVRKPTDKTIDGHQEVQPTDGSDKENSNQDGTVESTSELPTSYSFSEGTSARSIDRPRLPEKSVSDPGALITGLAEATTQRGPFIPPTKAPGEDAPDNPKTKASAVHVSSKRPRISRDTSDSELEILSRFPSQLLPPGSQTSIAPFATHVTPTLQHLVEQSAVSKVFNPISQARELEASERGYWLVPCQEWSAAEKVSFWESLEKSVPTAGWGVWCSRGPDHQLQDSVDEQGALSRPFTDTALEKQSFGPVRVWCWGEVVKHVYLMLYVASKSKVRKLGLQWIDSGGQVVVQMRR